MASFFLVDPAFFCFLLPCDGFGKLLVEMDGFEQNSGVIVIAATNFPESLDHALTRPGRFDKHVVVPLPDVKGREAILELYGSKTKLATDTNLKQLAQGTPGMSGADLFNIVNQVRRGSYVFLVLFGCLAV